MDVRALGDIDQVPESLSRVFMEACAGDFSPGAEGIETVMVEMGGRVWPARSSHMREPDMIHAV